MLVAVDQRFNKLLGVADRSGHQCAVDGAGLAADNTADLHRDAVPDLLRHVFLIAGLILPAVCRFVKFIGIGVEHHAELHVHQFIVVVRNRFLFDCFTCHDLLGKTGDLIRVAESQTVERHAVDLIVFIDNEDGFVLVLRPVTAQHIVLLVQKRLIAVDQRPDVHAVRAHLHDLRVRGGHGVHVIAEHRVIRIDQRIRVDSLHAVCGICEIDLRLDVVVIFDRVSGELLAVILKILLEARHIVLLHLRDHCIEHLCALPGGIDLVERVIVLVLCLTGEILDDAGEIDRLREN